MTDVGDIIGAYMDRIRCSRGITRERAGFLLGLGVHGHRQVRRWEQGMIPTWRTRLTLPWHVVYGDDYLGIVRKALSP